MCPVTPTLTLKTEGRILSKSNLSDEHFHQDFKTLTQNLSLRPLHDSGIHSERSIHLLLSILLWLVHAHVSYAPRFLPMSATAAQAPKMTGMYLILGESPGTPQNCCKRCNGARLRPVFKPGVVQIECSGSAARGSQNSNFIRTSTIGGCWHRSPTLPGLPELDSEVERPSM